MIKGYYASSINTLTMVKGRQLPRYLSDVGCVRKVLSDRSVQNGVEQAERSESRVRTSAASDDGA
jgi:hypothetical protein